ALGHQEKVVELLKRVLSDPSLIDYYNTAFLTYSRLGLPVNEILKSGVPATTPALSRLLDFWATTRKADEAVATWNWSEQHAPVSGESIKAFFEFLISSGQQVTAQQLWQQ